MGINAGKTPAFRKELLTRKGLYLATLAIGLLILFIYYPAFCWLVQRWYKVSRYSHGFLVVPIAVYLVWQQREELKQLRPQPVPAGLVIILLALLVQAVTAVLDIKTVAVYSFILLLWGIVLYAGGREWLRRIFFPILYLAFSVPPPLFFIIGLSNRLRLLASALAEHTLDLLGIVVVREGVMLHLSNASLEVADPCSGIQSLFALLALSGLYAHLWHGSLLKKWLLFLSAVPLAVVSNVVRIVILCAATLALGQEAAVEGFFHIFSGLMVFVVAFSGLFALGRILQWHSQSEH